MSCWTRCCGLAFHSSTTIWRKSCRWWLSDYGMNSSPVGPITVQWCSFMDFMMAKQTFSWPTPDTNSTIHFVVDPACICSMARALYTSDMAYHCMDHGNNDLCELSTDGWAVHPSNIVQWCTDGYLALYRMDPLPHSWS